MSQKIAPGRWDPAKRKEAKAWAMPVGVGLIAVGMALGLVLTRMLLMSGAEATMWAVLMVLVPSIVPTLLGIVVVFPDVVTPILYRIIDKVGKDS